jgi:Ca-activated chloride channel family protein
MGLPLHMAVALDTSSSMEKGKLDRAKEACLSIVELLREGDHLSLCGYSTQLKELFRRLPGGPTAVATAETALAELSHKGVTRTDLALDWVEDVLAGEGGGARIGMLITDGHPTDVHGKNLEDVSFLVQKARDLASSGISLCTVGLGSAQNFNTSFLLDLSNEGRGTFLHAATPEELEKQLRRRFIASQALAADDVRLKLKALMPGVKINACCRIRPDFLPLDKPAEVAGESILIGAVRVDLETDLLISIEVPALAFGEPPGSHEVMSVSLEATPLLAPLTATVGILFSGSYQDAQDLNEEVNTDRILWDINAFSEELQRTTNPRRTGELLSRIQDGAERMGLSDLADRASGQITDLKKEGKLNPEKATGLLSSARNLTAPGSEDW